MVTRHPIRPPIFHRYRQNWRHNVLPNVSSKTKCSMFTHGTVANAVSHSATCSLAEIERNACVFAADNGRVPTRRLGNGTCVLAVSMYVAVNGPAMVRPCTRTVGVALACQFHRPRRRRRAANLPFHCVVGLDLNTLDQTWLVSSEQVRYRIQRRFNQDMVAQRRFNQEGVGSIGTLVKT